MDRRNAPGRNGDDRVLLVEATLYGHAESLEASIDAGERRPCCRLEASWEHLVGQGHWLGVLVRSPNMGHGRTQTQPRGLRPWGPGLVVEGMYEGIAGTGKLQT